MENGTQARDWATRRYGSIRIGKAVDLEMPRLEVERSGQDSISLDLRPIDKVRDKQYKQTGMPLYMGIEPQFLQLQPMSLSSLYSDYGPPQLCTRRSIIRIRCRAVITGQSSQDFCLSTPRYKSFPQATGGEIA